MPDWIITLLVQFLIEFLTQLFKHLFGASDPAPSKAKFVSAVKWRFWYGPGRTAKAGELYDHAVAKFNAGAYQLPMGPWQDANAAVLANQLCADLKKQYGL